MVFSNNLLTLTRGQVVNKGQGQLVLSVEMPLGANTLLDIKQLFSTQLVSGNQYFGLI